MSSGQGSFPPSEEPLDAEVVEHAPPPSRSARPQAAAPPLVPFERPRRSRWPLIGCGGVLFVALLLMCGGSIYMIYSSAKQIAAAKPAVEPAKPLTEQQPQIAQALDGVWHVSETDPKYRDVRRLLANLEHAGKKESGESLGRLVDWPSHMERFYKAYRHPVNYGNRGQLEELEHKQFVMPPEASRFRIASIDERSPEHWLVYTYAQEGELEHLGYVFELRYTGGAWKLVDWAELAEMCWASERNAVGCGPTNSDTQRAETFRFADTLAAADEHLRKGEHPQAEAQLRQAEGCNVPLMVQPSTLHLVAVRWYQMGNYDEAERVLRRISNFDRFPWAHHLTAQMRFRQGKYAEALASIDAFEKCAGFYYDLELYKVRCQTELKQTQAAAETALKLVRFAPEEDEALRLALEHVPAAELKQVLSLLPSDAERGEKLVSNARSLLYQNAVEKHQAVRDYVARQDPNSGDVLRLDAQLWHYQGDFDRALPAYKKLVESAEPDKKTLARYDYLRVLLAVKPALEAYREAGDPRETLDALTSGIDDGEALIQIEDLKKLLPLHAERDPQDPKLPWYEAQVAIEEQDWSTAVTKIKAALESLPDDDARDYLEEELKRQLVQARCELGQALDVYREADDKAEVYRSLAQQLDARKDWKTLAQLNELHSDASDLWRRYYALRIAEEAARKSDNTEQLAALLPRYQQLERDNQATKTVYEFYLQSRITELGTEGPGWRAFFQSHADPATLLPRLTARFRREQNRAALVELMNLARQKLPNDEAVFGLEIDDLWEQRDYAAIIARYQGHQAGMSSSRYYDYAARARRDRLLASYLMVGDIAKAWELASSAEGNVRQQWVVRLAQADVVELRKLLQEHRSELYAPLSLEAAGDAPAVKQFIASEDFRQLRNEFALPIDEIYPDLRSVLLYREAPAWTKERLMERLRTLGLAEISVEALPQPPLVNPTFRLTWGTSECLLTAGDKPFVTMKELSGYGSMPEDLAQAVQTHQGWVTIEQARGASAAEHAAWKKLVASLGSESLALWAWLPQAQVVRTCVTPEVAEKLRGQADSLDQLAEAVGSGAWMLPSSVSIHDELEESKSWHARARAALAGGKLGRVRTRVTWGTAVEEHWLEVVAVHDEHWGNFSLDAKLTDASALYPLFRAGDVVRLSRYDIEAWEESP